MGGSASGTQSSGTQFKPQTSILQNMQNMRTPYQQNQSNQYQNGMMNQPMTQTRNQLFQNQFQLGMNGSPTGYYGQQVRRPIVPQMQFNVPTPYYNPNYNPRRESKGYDWSGYYDGQGGE